mmetsp:Transcript_9397/g.14525  ORF Transcript_9397/g.14525 Transcript_9397/m.14525 type:complete len:412 (+) Transcript_9397:235-1470(+)
MSPQESEKTEAETAGALTLLSLTIPEGKKPGETFQYTDEDGLELEITVPEDGKAGDKMEILIDNEDDDIEAVSVALGPHVDVTLNMVTFLDDPDEIIAIAGDDNEEGDAKEEEGGKTITELIQEEEDDIDDDEFDGTNFMVWPAGIELAQFLASPFAKTLIHDKKNALELGSGCGVAGMALTAALARGDNPKDTQVTLSDLPHAMSLLTANFEENKEELFNNSGIQAKTAPLSWGDEECLKTHTQEKKYDLVVAADVLYNAEDTVIKNLSSTIDAVLDPDSGLILLAQRWRRFDEERAFFEEMEKIGYEFVHVKSRICELGGKTTYDDGEEKKEDAYVGLDDMCELTWKEFGNKDSSNSQKYFSETTFETKDGAKKSLADIDEEDLEVMGDDDFDNCELAFIQIYAGRKKQ